MQIVFWMPTKYPIITAITSHIRLHMKYVSYIPRVTHCPWYLLFLYVAYKNKYFVKNATKWRKNQHHI